MITEIITFQLKPKPSLAGPDFAANETARTQLAAELKVQGAESACYGQFIEKPGTGIIFVNWDSVDDHAEFKSSL